MMKIIHIVAIAPPGVFTVVVADWSSPHGGNMMVLRRLGGLVDTLAAHAVQVVGVPGVSAVVLRLPAVDVGVAVAVVGMGVVWVSPPAHYTPIIVPMVQTPPTGLWRCIAGIWWQQPLHTAVTQPRLPEFSGRWEVVEVCHDELLLAVVDWWGLAVSPSIGMSRAPGCVGQGELGVSLVIVVLQQMCVIVRRRLVQLLVYDLVKMCWTNHIWLVLSI